LALAGKAQEQVDQLIGAYLELTEALARDKYEGALEKLKVLRQAAMALAAGEEPKLTAHGREIAGAVSAEPRSLETLRAALRLLTPHMLDLVHLAPPTKETAAALYQAYCPMTKASWLQKSSEVANPYYGAKMLRCGKITETIQAANSARP
jgi:hypothetical protein